MSLDVRSTVLRHLQLTTDRNRTARVAVASTLVALTAAIGGRVFDGNGGLWYPLLVVPVAVVGVLPALGSHRRRLGAHVAVALVELWIVAWRSGSGRLSTVIDGVVRGWSRALSTAWPSPPRPDLIVFVAATVIITAIVTVELSRSGRFRAAVLAPSVALSLLLIGLAAPAGRVPGWWWVAWVVVALVVLALGDGEPSAVERLRRSATERGPVVTMAAVLVAATVGMVTIGLGDRADPRREDGGRLDPIASIDPLASVVASRMIDPPVDVVRIDNPPNDRWRLFALERYDGVSWSVGPVFGPVGRRLPARAVQTTPVDVSVAVLGGQLEWLPVAGEMRRLDRDALADPDRSMFRLDPAAGPGSTVHMAVALPEVGNDVQGVAVQEIDDADELLVRLRATAIELAGQTVDPNDQLTRLAEALRSSYRLDPTAPSAVNAGVLERMLATTREGTEEQYVAAFTLLARSLGARARVAIGYVLPPDSTGVLTTADARAWPEVWSESAGWLAFDAVPTDVSAAEPEPVSELDERAATPPPPVVPPVSTPQEEPPETTETSSSSSLFDRVATAVVVVVATLSLFALLVGSVVGGIVLAKRRRRRRRLNDDHTSGRIIGAWAEATDTLVDHGAAFEAHQTNVEIAEAGTLIAGDDALEPLRSLALLANHAAHGPVDLDEMTVTHSIRLLGQVEQAIALRHTRWERFAAVITARSLRRRTRSPVR